MSTGLQLIDLHSWLFAAVVFTALVPVTAAYVTSHHTRPFRFWASHPWRVFWLSYLLGPLVLITLLPFVTGGATSLPRPATLALALAVAAPAFLTTIVSASLGLRRTWQKSRRKAALIILVVAGFIVSVSGPPATGLSPEQAALRLFTPSAVAISWWVLMAITTDYFAWRLILRDSGKSDAHATDSPR